MRLGRPRLPSPPRAKRATAAQPTRCLPAPLHRSFLRAFSEDRLFAEFPSLCEGTSFWLSTMRESSRRVIGGVQVFIRSLLRGHQRPSIYGKNRDSFSTRGRFPDVGALVRPGRKMQVGERILFGEGELEAGSVARPLGLRMLRFTSQVRAMSAASWASGATFLFPRTSSAPMNQRPRTLPNRFRKRPGAIAAPTARPSLSTEILETSGARGVEICELTLHVGLGTFSAHSQRNT